MMQLHLPWLLLSVAIPLVGACWVAHIRNAETAQKHSIAFIALTLLCAVGAWLDFDSLHTGAAHDLWDAFSALFGPNFPVIDELSAPLLPLAALLYLLTSIATLRTKVKRFSFAGNLASLAILLATFSCSEPWILVGLLIAGAVPPYWEMRAQHRPTRVFLLHMGLMSAMLILGVALISRQGADDGYSVWAALPLWIAVFIRCGIAPFHCWMTDLFEHVTFGSAMLHGTPMVGAYACVRLALPHTPQFELHYIGFIALFTAVYAGGMSLVQCAARRFYCFLLLSHTALVVLGLDIATPNSFAGALCVWLSVALALTGFGLTLRAIESRTGRVSLLHYHGLYEHMPTLAAFFLLTGLASVGFPGTFGFIGTEMLVDGVVTAYPYVGAALVIATAITGIAVLKAYFTIFTGLSHVASISLRRRTAERIAVLCLGGIILGGGLFPQPAVTSRHHAAKELLRPRLEAIEAAHVAHRDAATQQAAVQKAEVKPSVP